MFFSGTSGLKTKLTLLKTSLDRPMHSVSPHGADEKPDTFFHCLCRGNQMEKRSHRNSAQQKLNVQQHLAQENWQIRLEQKLHLAFQYWGPLQSHAAAYFLTRPNKNELIAVYHNKDEIYVWIDSGWIYSAFWKIKAWFKHIVLFCFLWDSQPYNHSMRFK